jgi:hypothetical protein
LHDVKRDVRLRVLNRERKVDKGRNDDYDHAGDQRNRNYRFEDSGTHTFMRGELN